MSGSFAICRLTPDGVVPDWAGGEFFSITGSAEDLSIVCPAMRVPVGVRHERDWACFRLEGPFPFSETGILVSFVQPLSERAIPIFALSTFDTDYVLVKEAWVEKALEAWQDAGHVAL